MDRRPLAALVAACLLVAALGGVAVAGGDYDHHDSTTTTTTATTTATTATTTSTTTPTATTHTTTTHTTKTTTGGVTVEGSPDLRAFAPNRTVAPGERRRLVVQLSNGGTVDEGGTDVPPELERQVTTARNVRLRLGAGDAPVEVRTGTTALGDLPSGAIAQTPFDVAVDPDADPGVYYLPVTVRYQYTDSISPDERDDDDEREKLYVKLVVTENARFEIRDVDADLQVGESGTVSVTVENVGEEMARRATVAVRSGNRDLRVDSGGETVRYVGRWKPGEERTVSVEATATNRSGDQRYALEAVVGYTDRDDRRRRSRPLAFGVRLDEEQAFSVDDVSGTLRVGEDGTVRGTVTNEGPRPVADAVVRLAGDEDVVPQRSTFVLGDLDDGEDEDFRFPVRVPETAKPGERQLSFVVDYRTWDGDPRRSDPLVDTVRVRPQRDRFEVRDVDADLQVGRTGSVSVTLENVGREDLTDATVTVQSLNGDLRVDSGRNATRYVGSWDAGDERTVSVEALLTNRSSTDRYPLRVVVDYDDGDGDPRRSTLLVGVRPDAEQRFALRDVTDTLRIGEEGRVNGTVRNRGPRDVSQTVVRLVSTDPNLRPRETVAVLGDLDEGDDADFSLPVSVLDAAQPGPRRLLFVVDYFDGDGDPQRSERLPVVVTAARETDRFSLRAVDADVQAADTGSVVLTLRNRGNETLSDATVSLSTTGLGVRVGGGVNDTRFVGSWAPGETRTVEYRVRAGNETGDQTYAFRASVAYEDGEDQSRRSPALVFGLAPAAEQRFAVATVASTLRVGEEGRVETRLTNRGPRNASAVALELVAPPSTVSPLETAVAVGDLAADASAVASLPVEVSASGDAGTRQFTYRVRYRDDDGDLRRSRPLVAAVRVAPERDPFLVTAARTNVTAGERTTVTLTLTNNRGEPVRDVRAKAFADAPLTVDDDQAFVARLAPNESTTVQFDVTAAGDAGEKTYPLTVDVQYTTPAGDTLLSDPVDVGVSVARPPERGIPDWAFLVVALVVLLAVAAWLVRRWRRRGGAADGNGAGEGEQADEGTAGSNGDGSAEA